VLVRRRTLWSAMSEAAVLCSRRPPASAARTAMLSARTRSSPVVEFFSKQTDCTCGWREEPQLTVVRVGLATAAWRAKLWATSWRMVMRVLVRR